MVNLNNVLAGVIDELNDRMEVFVDNEEYEKLEVLQEFYDWLIEKYIT